MTVVGGLDLFPPGPGDRDGRLRRLARAEVGIEHELLDVAEIAARWPQFALPAGHRRAVPGARRDRAGRPGHRRAAGAGPRRTARCCATEAPVIGVRDLAPPVEVDAGGDDVLLPRGVVVCADAWTNDVLAGLDHRIPLTMTLEQVTYFAPDRPGALRSRGGCRCGSGWTSRRTTASPATARRPSRRPRTAAARRSTRTPAPFEPDPEMQALLAAHMARMLPGSGRPVRSLRCQYTLTPDRDFVMDPVPGHPSVSSGSAPRTASSSRPPSAGSSPTSRPRGRRPPTSPPSASTAPALTDPEFVPNWMV